MSIYRHIKKSNHDPICKICHHDKINEIENKIFSEFDFLEYGITQKELDYHNNNHIKILSHKSRKTKKLRKCLGCGMKYGIHGVQGYCSYPCLRKYNLTLYLKRNEGSYKYRPKKELNKYGLLFEPDNEQEVVFLFTKIHERLGFKYIKTMQITYPDCIAIDENGNEIRIEFEFKSSRFNHNLAGCDLIICWEHDDKLCTKRVICLKDVLKNEI